MCFHTSSHFGTETLLMFILYRALTWDYEICGDAKRKEMTHYGSKLEHGGG